MPPVVELRVPHHALDRAPQDRHGQQKSDDCRAHEQQPELDEVASVRVLEIHMCFGGEVQPERPHLRRRDQDPKGMAPDRPFKGRPGEDETRRPGHQRHRGDLDHDEGVRLAVALIDAAPEVPRLHEPGPLQSTLVVLEAHQVVEHRERPVQKNMNQPREQAPGHGAPFITCQRRRVLGILLVVELRFTDIHLVVDRVLVFVS
mmetsp:Transcript_3330/g.10228  ORF Transcript_3330/g.10228 Transcript_3330/m.10228 type:complete len:203 (-) Transcript_3330:2516-3124(-)